MLTFWATIGVQVIYLPLIVLLVVGAIRRHRPFARLATAVLLLAAGGLGPVVLLGDTQSLLNAVTLTSAALLLATYPNGRFTPRWSIVVVAAVAAVQLTNVLSGFTFETYSQPWWWIFNCLWLAVLVFWGQLHRYLRRSSVEERDRARWALLGAIVQVTLFTVWSFVSLGTVGMVGSTDATAAVAVVFNSFLPLGFAAGLLVPRALPIDRILRVTLIVAVVALVESGLLLLLISVLPLGPAPTAWTCAAVVAIITAPLAWIATRFADLVVYNGRPDPLRTLTSLGERLDHSVDPLEVPQVVVDTIRSALSLQGVALRGAVPLEATSGELPAVAASFPIVYQSEIIGTIDVAAREGESTLTAQDRSLIDHLILQSAGALHGARAISELIDARARVVLAREEERRRLRRDLHDDLAPTFAGLGLGAAAVQEYARTDDPRAGAAAGDLVQGLQDATRQLREIAYDLRPPVLDDQGLVAAIRDRVESPGTVPTVEVVAPAVRLELPAAVEAAALRIVQEAVMNVRRHAAATTCVVSVEVIGGRLAIRVLDDGRGIPSTRTNGVGLRSIRERVDELGGTLELGTAPSGGGTLLAVSLPAVTAGAAS